jgi:allantoinase
VYDLILRGGDVATPDGAVPADVAVADGLIAAVGQGLPGGREEIDARGLHVLPGGIDPHVHFNEPGRTDWEGFATGTAALAAGGFTAFFDMPLNSLPPVIDGPAFDAKLEAARASAVVDYGLWGGIVPGNRDRLEELAERGVVGFKAFMSDSGIADFPRADDVTLYEGMAEAARLGRIVAVHAENDALTSRRRGPMARDWLESRPLVAELEAIGRAIAFAQDTGCALHIVHVSHGHGVELVRAARERGVDVTCETCPHYLVLTDEDAERLGAVAKCAPPLRPREEGEALWSALADRQLPMIASDHSPSPPELKQSENAFEAWGGIAGAQTLLALTLGEGERRGIPLDTLVAAISSFPARRFALPGKGALEIGADADLALVRPDTPWTLTAEHLRSRHPLSPFIGRELRHRVVRTLLRGRTVQADGQIVAEPGGRLVRMRPRP